MTSSPGAAPRDRREAGATSSSARGVRTGRVPMPTCPSRSAGRRWTLSRLALRLHAGARFRRGHGAGLRRGVVLRAPCREGHPDLLSIDLTGHRMFAAFRGVASQRVGVFDGVLEPAIPFDRADGSGGARAAVSRSLLCGPGAGGGRNSRYRAFTPSGARDPRWPRSGCQERQPRGRHRALGGLGRVRTALRARSDRLHPEGHDGPAPAARFRAEHAGTHGRRRALTTPRAAPATCSGASRRCRRRTG